MHEERITAPVRIALVCGVALAGVPGAAWSNQPSVEITPLVGYRSHGSFKDTDSEQTRDLDESASFGLILNIDHDANTQWEFMLSRQSTELQLGPLFTGDRLFDLDVTYFSAGGIYVWRDPKIEPFVGAGFGITYMSPQDSRYDSETRAMIQLVAGYKFFLTEQIGLRIEARGYGTLVDSDAAFFCGDGQCIVRVESDGFGQLELNAGLVVRF